MEKGKWASWSGEELAALLPSLFPKESRVCKETLVSPGKWTDILACSHIIFLDSLMSHKYLHEITFSDSSTSAFGSSVVNTQPMCILRGSGFSGQVGPRLFEDGECLWAHSFSPHSLPQWVQRISNHLKRISIRASGCRASVCNVCGSVVAVGPFPSVSLTFHVLGLLQSHMEHEKISWTTWCPCYNLTS